MSKFFDQRRHQPTEVHAAARSVSPSVGAKVKLYYKQTDDVNAYAVGHRTIIVTDGILALSDKDLKGVLAHEFGHIANGDSDLTLGINVSNTILVIFTALVGFVVTTMSSLFSMLFESVDAKATCAAIAGVIVLALSLVYYLWVKFGMLLVNASSRNNEYAADAFAVDCGFGAGLYSALSQLDPSKTRSGFFSLLASSHPDTVARLEKIRLRLGASAQAATTAI